jgi:hypothetical protein
MARESSNEVTSVNSTNEVKVMTGSLLSRHNLFRHDMRELKTT